MTDRRTFLSGLVSLPLIGGGVTLIGRPAAAVPLVQAAALPTLDDPRQRARYAWEAFSAAMRDITADADGWVINGAGRAPSRLSGWRGRSLLQGSRAPHPGAPSSPEVRALLQRAPRGVRAVSASQEGRVPLAGVAVGPNDARLVALANAYEALDRRCNEHAAAHKGLTGEAAVAADTEFDGLVEGYGPIETEVATTPADSLVGVLAKARLCQVPIARGTARTDHILSVVDDIHRLFGGHHA